LNKFKTGDKVEATDFHPEYNTSDDVGFSGRVVKYYPQGVNQWIYTVKRGEVSKEFIQTHLILVK
jgi:hypothetical protein